jgi:cytolysin-activating lysine-acyltransferase
MRPSPIDVYETPPDSGRWTNLQQKQAEQLGYGTMLCRSARLDEKRFVTALITLSQAIEHSQVQFYFNDNGKVVGYVCWGRLSPDVELRLLRGNAELHISEWNEGEVFWIIDLVAPFGHLRRILSMFSKTIGGNAEIVRYVRVTSKGRRIARSIIRHGG